MDRFLWFMARRGWTLQPGGSKALPLLGVFVLAYAAVVLAALGHPILMATGTFAVSFAAVSVLTRKLEGRT